MQASPGAFLNSVAFKANIMTSQKSEASSSSPLQVESFDSNETETEFLRQGSGDTPENDNFEERKTPQAKTN